MKDIKCENSTPIDERNQLVPRLIIGPNHILRTGFMVSSVRFMKPPVQPANRTFAIRGGKRLFSSSQPLKTPMILGFSS
jgi:hypothetical protein